MRATQPHLKLATADPLFSDVVAFHVQVSHGRDAATVRVAGELDLAGSSELEDLVIACGRNGRPVLLDLTGTTFIDSAGIRVLVRSMWALQGAGSRLTLVAASPMAENILRITGILDVLKDPAP